MERCEFSRLRSPLTRMLCLSLGITLVCLTRNALGEDATPADWPTRFYALLYQNFSGDIGIMDLYYDWEQGRNLHLIKNQLKPVTHDMLYQDGTVLRWEEGEKCRRFDVGVGLLPPNWLKGATYLGTETSDGFSVNVWTKADFIWYREDVVTKRPVGWTFYTGREVHVISFQPGFVLDEEDWKVPADCFTEDVKVKPSASDVQVPTNPLADIGQWMAKTTSA